MRIYLLALLLLLAVWPTMQAQRRQKVVEPELPDISVEEALGQYDFPLATQLLNRDIAQLRRRRQPTLLQEEQLQWIQRAQLKLNAVEQVTFVDSILVPRASVLSHIPLGAESGSLASCASYFSVPDSLDCTLFRSQWGDRIVYAKPDTAGVLSLYSSYLYDDNTASAPECLTNISDNADSQNYPFMMADGTTIYFAAQGSESLGGYDIFMSRYDAEEHRFLMPENIGMPFNSPANDYLFVVDEFNHLGWFVTDRNAPLDSVCVYTFIPNDTRRVYLPEEVGPDTLRNLARITSIRDTWTDDHQVRAAQFRLREMNDSRKFRLADEFRFVVTAGRVYRRRSDFQSPSALAQLDAWLNACEQLRKTRATLVRLRADYHAADASRRQQLSPEILQLESGEQSLKQQVSHLANSIRKSELGL